MEDKRCIQIHVNKIAGLRPSRSHGSIECYVAAKVQDDDQIYEVKSDKAKGVSDFAWHENLERLNLRSTCQIQFSVRTSTRLRLQKPRVVAKSLTYPLSALIEMQGQSLMREVYIDLPLHSADDKNVSLGTLNINIRSIIRDTGREAAEYIARRKTSLDMSPTSYSAPSSLDGHSNRSDSVPPSPLSPIDARNPLLANTSLGNALAGPSVSRPNTPSTRPRASTVHVPYDASGIETRLMQFDKIQLQVPVPGGAR